MRPEPITHATSPDWIGTEYSNCCPFNADNSRILLVHRDHFISVDPSGGNEISLPIAAAQEPRWSISDPNIFYYVTDARFGTKAQFMRYDVTQGQASAVTTFPYAVLSGRGESDICRDGDHFVLCGDNKDIFLYSLNNGKEASYFQSATFDGLKITPQSKILISGDFGIIAQPGHRQVTKVNGHAAVASYQGRDILLWCSSADPVANENAVVMIDLDNPASEPQPLLHLPWAYAFHISTCDKDFCMVSAFDTNNDLPCQLWRVSYDGTAPLLLYSFSIAYRDYTSQPKASLSRDGSMAVFSVDDGKSVNTWLMRLDDVKQDASSSDDGVSFPSYKEIDFTADEGRSWLWHFTVVNGKMVTRVFDKLK